MVISTFQELFLDNKSDRCLVVSNGRETVVIGDEADYGLVYKQFVENELFRRFITDMVSTFTRE